MKRAKKQFVLYWLPVMVLCGVLFAQSCFPSFDVGPSFPLKDKVLHMAAYGVLAALFYRACRATWAGSKSPAHLLVISVCFATFYGVSDEVHQAFVAARQADGYDVVADFIGSILGVAGYLVVTLQGRLSRFPKARRRLQ